MSPAPALHDRLPVRPWADPLARRLPGLQPVPAGQWLVRDEVFPGQMAERDRLLASRPGDVLASPPAQRPACDRLLAAVLAAVRADPGYRVSADSILRPDGVAIALDCSAPLLTAARLVQEDLLLLRPGPDEFELVAGVLCFPASWTLAEKLGRPMSAIHRPVARYDAGLARRVETLMRRLPPAAPVWRANAFRYNAADLHHPRPEADPRRYDPAGPTFIRIERQTLMRLADSDAVVFTIHTSLTPLAAVDPIDLAAMDAWLAGA